MVACHLDNFGHLKTIGVFDLNDDTISYCYDANDRILSEANDDVDDSKDTYTRYYYTLYNRNTGEDFIQVYAGLNGSGALRQWTHYTWNVQSRLISTVTDKYGDNYSLLARNSTTNQYDSSGNRWRQLATSTTYGENSSSTGTNILYVVDTANPSGYAQTLEQWQGAQLALSYTLGLDVLGQNRVITPTQNTTDYLVYDGHGSTRGLADGSNTIEQNYAYDSYGNMLSGPGLVSDAASALTCLLYSGEQTDWATKMQYLRARYYAPITGRFVSYDFGYEGDIRDPTTLHKYLYANANPIYYTDPSGRMSLGEIGLVATLNGVIAGAITGTYGYARGWSAKQIAKASLISGFTAFGATLAFFGTAGLITLGGASMPIAMTATGLMVVPTTLGLAIGRFAQAAATGDEVEICYATVDLGLSLYGTVMVGMQTGTVQARQTAESAAIAERLAALKDGYEHGAAGGMVARDGTILTDRSTNAGGGGTSRIDARTMELLEGMRKTCVEPRVITQMNARGIDPKGAWSSVLRVSDGARMEACPQACRQLLSRLGVNDANQVAFAPVIFLLSHMFE